MTALKQAAHGNAVLPPKEGGGSPARAAWYLVLIESSWRTPNDLNFNGRSRLKTGTAQESAPPRELTGRLPRGTDEHPRATVAQGYPTGLIRPVRTTCFTIFRPGRAHVTIMHIEALPSCVPPAAWNCQVTLAPQLKADQSSDGGL